MALTGTSSSTRIPGAAAAGATTTRRTGSTSSTSLATPVDTQTLYTLQTVFGGTPKRIVGYTVLEIRVRTAFEPLEEFGPSRQYKCSDDWQETSTPRFLPA